jgi:hypothetical protein
VGPLGPAGGAPGVVAVVGAAPLITPTVHRVRTEPPVVAATADDNGPPGRDDGCGYGVLNVVKALTADVPPLEGTAAPGAPAIPAAAVPTPAPQAGPGSTTGPLVGGAAIGAVVVGGVVAFLVTRRRRGGELDR